MDLICKNNQKIHHRTKPNQSGMSGHKSRKIRRSEETNVCRNGYTVTLDNGGTIHQPEIAGSYVRVCFDNGKPIFR